MKHCLECLIYLLNQNKNKRVNGEVKSSKFMLIKTRYPNLFHACDFPCFNVMNRPFPSSLVPLFQNESKCETFHMKMSSACSFIFMQIKVIFIRMVSHLDSL